MIYHITASNEDVVRGYLHAKMCERHARESPERSADYVIKSSYATMTKRSSGEISFAENFIQLLRVSDWHLARVFLNQETGRYTLEAKRRVRARGVALDGHHHDGH